MTCFHPLVKLEGQAILKWRYRFLRGMTRLLLFGVFFCGLLFLIKIALPSHEAFWVAPISLLVFAQSFVLAGITAWKLTCPLSLPKS